MAEDFQIVDSEHGTQVTLEGLDIFLVEDDFLILLDLKTILEDAGATVVTAASVREGLELSEKVYSAAILDIRLPDGMVFPVAERLSKSRVPIIFHSGNAEASTVKDLFPEAIALLKPAQEHMLIDTIKQNAIVPS